MDLQPAVEMTVTGEARTGDTNRDRMLPHLNVVAVRTTTATVLRPLPGDTMSDPQRKMRLLKTMADWSKRVEFRM
jgi:hypothetical protein